MFYYEELRIPCLSQLRMLTHVGVWVTQVVLKWKSWVLVTNCREVYGCTGELQLWQFYVGLSWLCFCKCIHCSFILIWERIDKHTWGRNSLLNRVSVEFIEDEELLVCVKFVLFEPEPLPCKCCINLCSSQWLPAHLFVVLDQCFHCLEIQFVHVSFAPFWPLPEVEVYTFSSKICLIWLKDAGAGGTLISRVAKNCTWKGQSVRVEWKLCS